MYGEYLRLYLRVSSRMCWELCRNLLWRSLYWFCFCTSSCRRASASSFIFSCVSSLDSSYRKEFHLLSILPYIMRRQKVWRVNKPLRLYSHPPKGNKSSFLCLCSRCSVFPTRPKFFEGDLPNSFDPFQAAHLSPLALKAEDKYWFPATKNNPTVLLGENISLLICIPCYQVQKPGFVLLLLLLTQPRIGPISLFRGWGHESLFKTRVAIRQILPKLFYLALKPGILISKLIWWPGKEAIRFLQRCVSSEKRGFRQKNSKEEPLVWNHNSAKHVER